MLPSFDWTFQSTEVPHPTHTASPTNAHAPRYRLVISHHEQHVNQTLRAAHAAHPPVLVRGGGSHPVRPPLKSLIDALHRASLQLS